MIQAVVICGVANTLCWILYFIKLQTIRDVNKLLYSVSWVIGILGMIVAVGFGYGILVCINAVVAGWCSQVNWKITVPVFMLGIVMEFYSTV